MRPTARRITSVALASAVLGAGGLAAVQPAQAQTTPKVLTYDSSTTFARRPATIGYTGDGTGFVGKRPWGARPGHLTWTKWNKKRAKGRGTIWLNRCEPNCAEGTFHKVTGSLTLTKPKRHRFRQLHIHFKDGGHTYNDVRRLRHFGDYYRWMPVS